MNFLEDADFKHYFKMFVIGISIFGILCFLFLFVFRDNHGITLKKDTVEYGNPVRVVDLIETVAGNPVEKSDKIIHRRDELRAAKSIQEKAFKNPKLFFMWDSVVEELEGDDILQAMYVKNVKTGEVTKVEADPEDGMFGLFGFIGTVPNTKIFEGVIDMDERGYIKTDADMHTNIPGVYAAGDVRVKSLRQVVTAAADGAIAAVQVERSMSDYF